jgi:hypothetical protein
MACVVITPAMGRFMWTRETATSLLMIPESSRSAAPARRLAIALPIAASV